VTAFAKAREWLATLGYAPFPFQEAVFDAYAEGRSGLIHAPTGMGKTYAAFLGPLLLDPSGETHSPPPLTVLWLTPLRALAQDTGLALARAAAALQPHWSVDVRTGDTAAGARARQ
jgi:ATP-dependent helicase Lhr and Lhr-like helicase